MLTEQRLDLLVVGGGPAGMSAARTAADVGLRVLLVDERPTLGGQIYKQPGPGARVTDPAAADRSHESATWARTPVLSASAGMC